MTALVLLPGAADHRASQIGCVFLFECTVTVIQRAGGEAVAFSRRLAGDQSTDKRRLTADVDVEAACSGMNARLLGDEHRITFGFLRDAGNIERADANLVLEATR